MDPALFRRHVRHYARNYDIIAPSDLLSGRLPKRPLLITFDDVYRSVLDIGGPILREVSAQSVWFMNPGSIAADVLPLDNLVSLAMERLGTAVVTHLLGLPESPRLSAPEMISYHVSRRSYAEIAELRANICARLGDAQRDLRRESQLFLERSDLPRLLDYGIQVGNHSMTHTFFRALSAAELDVEIRRSRELLESLSGQKVEYLAIPYGYEADATDEALSVARASGHSAIFLVQARSNATQPAPDIFYRVGPGNVPAAVLPVPVELLPRLRTLWHRLH
jgi:peptidoglycan/xylan/chitin deacetylase (PgdA/CDA1 family)